MAKIMLNGKDYSAPSVGGGDAETAERWKTARNINGMMVDGTGNGVNYAVCYSKSSAEEKTVNCPGFELIDGAEITIHFYNGNNVDDITLNVNDTGAHRVRHYNMPIGKIEIGEYIQLRYRGSQWNLVGTLAYPSGTRPKENGAVSIGIENNFARGDHVHPLQESVAKLSTARNISVSGDMVGSGTAFDGTKDISISVCRRGCAVGQLTSTATRPWYKFASIMLKRSDDVAITFRVSNKYASYAANEAGILTAHFRTDVSVMMEDAQLVWEYALSGINPDDFVLGYKKETSIGNYLVVNLYVKIDVPYKYYHFDVISEGTRENRRSAIWQLYNTSSNGELDAIDNSFTQVKSTLATLKNNVSNMLVPMYMGFQTLKGDKELTLQVKKFTFEDDGHTQWLTWEEIGLTKNYADVLVLCQPSYSNVGDIVWIGWERAGTDVGTDKSRFRAMASGWKNFAGNLWVTYFVAGTN